MAVIILQDNRRKKAIQRLTIYKVGKDDFILSKRSIMKEGLWTTLITVLGTLLTAIVGKLGYDRFKARIESRVQLKRIENEEVQYIVNTLKTFKEEATSELAILRKENTDLIIKNAALGSECNALKAEKATLEATNKALLIEIEKFKKTKT